jgi:hypothetical protein
MPLEEIIQASLLPRLLFISENKAEEERRRLAASFHTHVRILSEFMQHEFMDGSLSISALVGLHVLLFPPGYSFKAVGNDGIQVEMRPGEWRKQVLHPNIRAFSPIENVAIDLGIIVEAFNRIMQPSREDVLRFFMSFGKVHPFGDANGTVAALVCDALCFRHGFAPLCLQNIRFKDKSFGFALVAEFAADQSDESLTNILHKLDAFHRAFPIQRLS